MMQSSEELDEHFSASSEKAAKQFGALCLRKATSGRSKVLLITTRETKRWTIPKGWPMKGWSAHKVAKCEAWEEAGVKGRAKNRPFGYYTYLKRLAIGDVIPAIVEVHIIEVRRMRKNFPEAHQRRLTWVSPYDASRMIDEPELQSLLRKVERRDSR
jgi:8-oxo-dGTP pyrophosphatase MutT (NUDIX family)